MSDEGNPTPVARWVPRAQSLALIAYGFVSANCVIMTKAYTPEYGGVVMWWLSLAVGAVYLLLGVLLEVGRERVRWPVLAFVAIVFVLATFSRGHGRSQPVVLAAASVVALAFGVLLWPQPGRVRLFLGLAGVVGCGLQLANKTTDMLLFPPLTGPPVTTDFVLVDESACALSLPDVPATGSVSSPVTVSTEEVSGRSCTFVRFEAPGATFKDAKRAAEQWAAPRVKLPNGTRLAWGRDDAERDGRPYQRHPRGYDARTGSRFGHCNSRRDAPRAYRLERRLEERAVIVRGAHRELRSVVLDHEGEVDFTGAEHALG